MELAKLLAEKVIRRAQLLAFSSSRAEPFTCCCRPSWRRRHRSCDFETS